MSGSDNTVDELEGAGSATGSDAAGGLRSPEPPPGANLTTQERRVYAYLCSVLREAGLEHTTLGVVLCLVSQTWVALCEARRKCRVDGRTQTSKNGWHSSTPWADEELRCQKTLLELLPRAGLDLLTLAKVRKELGDDDPQDDLFGDLVKHAQSSPANKLLN